MQSISHIRFQAFAGLLLAASACASAAAPVHGPNGAGLSTEPRVSDAGHLSQLPRVDRYGQRIDGNWPGKVRDDADLATALAEENADLSAHPGAGDRDRWGGWASGPRLRATGRFRVDRHEGRPVLVTPDGTLFFSLGVCTVGADDYLLPDGTRVTRGTGYEARQQLFEGAPWLDPAFAAFALPGERARQPLYPRNHRPASFNFYGANLLRKHGPDWRDLHAERSLRRLRSWGFNTVGAFSDPAIILHSRSAANAPRLPYAIMLSPFGDRPLAGADGTGPRFPDPFGDMRAALGARLATLRATWDDPWCIGYFVGNELSWGDDTALARLALAAPPDQAARLALEQHLRSAGLDLGATPPDDVLRAFNRELATRFFVEARAAIRAVAPGALFLGSRFVWGWEQGEAPALCAAHADVVSYNLYTRRPERFRPQVPDDTPLLVSEFNFTALDRGHALHGPCSVEDQTARAAETLRFLRTLRTDPRVVGVHWFQYHDQPYAGRSLDGEASQAGLVSITDTPHAETLASFRTFAEEMYGVTRAVSPVANR